LVVLLNSAEEFRLAMARSTGYISVFFPAELPAAPARSSVTGYLLRGVVAGSIVGGGIAFLLDYLDDTIKAPQDVRQVLSLEVLAALPRVKSSNGRVPLVMAEHPLQPISEAFRSLRTNIEFATVDLQVRSILITSPLPTDGKTFVAANLATAFAQGGKRVALVDADLRHPRQHHQFDLPKGPGLTSALLAPEERESVLQSTEVDNLWVITGGPQAPNPAELLASGRMRQFVSWLKEEVDVVVIDSPPVLVVTDAAVLSNLVDGTIFVMECNRTRRPVAVQAMERLTSVGGKVLGVVLNRMKPNGDGYYYYYYYHGYGDNGASGNHRRGQWFSRLFEQGRHKSSRRRKAVKEGGESVRGADGG
jgi:capsular exopolysaccharide synthesis family protein